MNKTIEGKSPARRVFEWGSKQAKIAADDIRRGEELGYPFARSSFRWVGGRLVAGIGGIGMGVELKQKSIITANTKDVILFGLALPGMVLLKTGDRLFFPGKR